ncbi:MAG: GNAT family N-acetyltransferase [Thermococcus sp.]|nr:GNAT family N-acetyltransferase [Thermococcus sp.]
MEILRLDEGRLRDFQELYVEFFKELRGKQGFGYEEESYRKEAETYFKRGDLIFLAYEREPAGFIRLSPREGCFWVEELFVRPEFRGRGIGRALVERAEEEVKKHDDALYLLVLPQDKDAIAFWKKLGYDTINTIELVKDLEPTPRDSGFHSVELLGERFRIFRWRDEKFTEEEKRFMGLLGEFYKKGGTKEEFLRVINRALMEWLSADESKI